MVTNDSSAPLPLSGARCREQYQAWGPLMTRRHTPLRRPLLFSSSAWPPAASSPSVRLSCGRRAIYSSGTAGSSGGRRTTSCVGRWKVFMSAGVGENDPKICYWFIWELPQTRQEEELWSENLFCLVSNYLVLISIIYTQVHARRRLVQEDNWECKFSFGCLK